MDGSYPERLKSIMDRDKRYKPDAYAFVSEALSYTLHKLEKPRHVSAKELLEGIREYAGEQFGRMAPTVFAEWGVKSTEDFGEIVFNMVDAQLMSKTEADKRSDFKDVYNIRDAFETDQDFKLN